jgi:alpha-tubulin suppressor-like RCC1 family protein
VNGQLDGVMNTSSPLASAFPLWIGSSPFGADTNWRGDIDEVRVWAVARTPAEIQFDMTHYLTGEERGLRGYWPFDEGLGQTFADVTGRTPGFLGNSPQPDRFDPEWVSGVQLLPAVPVPVPELLSQITSQFEHSCIVKVDATLWCWGEASYGRLGNGTIAPPQFTPVQALLTNVKQVDAGVHQTCAVTHDDTPWCWGEGRNYKLGYGYADGRSHPTHIATLTDVAEIATNGEFSCARKYDGTAWCWGAGTNGQLGNGSTRTQQRPVQVSQATGLTFITQIAVSNRHTCAVNHDGTAWCWGVNGSGRLGDGTMTQRTRPTPVIGLIDIQQVVAGAHHSCALTMDGTVWCWGEDTRGEVGDGPVNTTPKLIPVQVAGLSQVGYLSAQVWHTCAVKTDGTVWCWGRNGTGQLGDGTTTDRHAPMPVSGLTDVDQVSAGYYASCAVKHDGTAWCWGAGGSGRLGNGSQTGSLTPVQVQNLP